MISQSVKVAWRQKSCSISSLKLAESLPAKFYHDKDIYNTEREKLIGPSWQLITHESLLLKDSTSAPATYFADTVAGWPCIIVRNSKTGILSGYHNVCRHRAGPLEWDGTSGPCKLNGLMCKYHGWTYSLDGKLKGLPRFGDHSTLDKSMYNLWPIRVVNWRGLIFAQLLPSSKRVLEGAPGAAATAVAMSGAEAEQLFLHDNAGLIDRLKDVPLESLQYHSSRTHPLKCNWKVRMEIFHSLNILRVWLTVNLIFTHQVFFMVYMPI